MAVKPLPKTDKSIGIDLGLTSLVTTSDGEKIPNLRPYKTAERRLARAQRRVSKRKLGSNRRRKAVVLLAKAHAHVANIRRENHIHVACALVEKADVICIEKLNVQGLSRSMLAKSVHDASWGNLKHWLLCKAESAGREVIEVDSRGTSQRCSQCDCVVEKKLSDRIHNCPHCGLVLDRDVNAAKNILRLGLSLRREASVVIEPCRPEKFAGSDC